MQGSRRHMTSQIVFEVDIHHFTGNFSQTPRTTVLNSPTKCKDPSVDFLNITSTCSRHCTKSNWLRICTIRRNYDSCCNPVSLQQRPGNSLLVRWSRPLGLSSRQCRVQPLACRITNSLLMSQVLATFSLCILALAFLTVVRMKQLSNWQVNSQHLLNNKGQLFAVGLL